MAQSINDTTSQKIKELVEQMKLYSNPQELEDMKKILKKNVPWTMRGYLLSYLYVTREEAARPKTQNVEREKKPMHSKAALENSTAFYINIGKTSKGSAREMTDFICEKTGLSAEDIVSVAYKQNYSFIYIRNEKKDGVIEAISGQSYKGKKVKMNFSKDKDEQ